MQLQGSKWLSTSHWMHHLCLTYLMIITMSKPSARQNFFFNWSVKLCRHLLTVAPVRLCNFSKLLQNPFQDIKECPAVVASTGNAITRVARVEINTLFCVQEKKNLSNVTFSFYRKPYLWCRKDVYGCPKDRCGSMIKHPPLLNPPSASWAWC